MSEKVFMKVNVVFSIIMKVEGFQILVLEILASEIRVLYFNLIYIYLLLGFGVKSSREDQRGGNDNNAGGGFSNSGFGNSGIF